MANIDNDILALWKELTPEEKMRILERIRMKASGVELEPLRLEELHPRNCRINDTPPQIKGA